MPCKHMQLAVFLFPVLGFMGTKGIWCAHGDQLSRLGRGTLVLWPLCTMVGYKTSESCPLLAVYIQTQCNLCLHI
jgi:hypothetical protein